ncbi:MAG: restriction endonuclease subunit S [Gallionella sp.]|nr:restriction endonuclease subunit S [Gallionella sp.]MDP1939970.1 restriction endonuclease subunit S [Gallionella sp.]
MSEWQEYLLEDVVEKFIDYRGKTPKKTDAGIPLVTAKVVKAGKILPPNEFIAPEDYDSWMTRGLPEIDDVVLTTEAPLGEVALIKDKNIALAQRIITLRGKRDLLFNPFLKFYFQNETGQHELQSRASGTTVFGIKASVLKKVPIELPPLSEQKSIAAVLSSLDDKIDLLHRQNQTLEAMAATLFRQWFVEEAQEDWEEVALEDVTSRITDGAHVSPSTVEVGGNPP